jgi:hypothetical protein
MQTHKWSRVLFFLFSLFVISSGASSAANISYSLTDLGSRQWQIDYQVTNFDSDVYDNFKIYLDYGQFENLTLVAYSSGWDTFVSEPVTILGSEEDGFLDALVENPSGILTAFFTVQVAYLGTDMPGAQSFELYSSDNWGTPVASGTSSPVPVPGALVLMLSGLAGLCTIRRKSGNNK